LVSLGGTSGHRSFINDVDSIIHPNAAERLTHSPTNEDLVVATVGDDNTLIVWQWSDDAVVVPVAYSLSSPGVSVGFCKHFTRRLLVAEEEGTIRILDWLASDDGRVMSSSGVGGGVTLWLLNIHMGLGLSMGVEGLLAGAEWCSDSVDGEGGRIVAVTKGGEWAVWDLTRIEGGGRTIPVERGQVVHATNVVAIR
jgi:WD40 repeat protein